MVDLDQTKESYLTQDQEKTEEWHRKAGHLGLNNMKKLIDMSTGMKLKKDHCNELKRVCEIWPSKQDYHLRQRASRCLEILHTDICGPIEPTTWGDRRYIWTVLDDYTHYSRIYLLRYKNETAEYLKESSKEAEALQNIKVAKVCCDNGEISKEFWGEAAYVATYLLNRSPTEAGNKTPIECWTGRKLDLSRLRIFGSTAYAKIVGYTQKLDSRISRDVVFTEPEQSVNNSRIKVRLNEYKTGDEGKDEDQYLLKEDPEQEWIPAEEQIQEGQEEDIQLGEGSDHTGSGRKIKIPVKLKDYILDLEDETFLTYQEAINGPEKVSG
ncbi:hypothetical protein Trydic_g1725 [Trypoxylus dichotomus]